MPPPQVSAEFTGVPPNKVVSCQYTRSHGITPGVATLECLPLTDFAPADGDLVMRCGAQEIFCPDCHLASHTTRVGPQGKVWVLSILDRRWKWRFGEISGTYNRRLDNLTGIQADIDQERKPRELMGLCLDAMGEGVYDLSQVPNDTRPSVDWDHANPAQALASLAELVGCRVCYRLDDSVAVVRLGYGVPLPEDGFPVIEDSLALKPPQLPTRIKVVCAPTLFQVELELEAVGLDGSGEVKLIDALNYKPDLGVLGKTWNYTAPGTFLDVVKVYRQLALRSVFRWYRIKTSEVDDNNPNTPPVPYRHQIPGYSGGSATYRQLLPLQDEQIYYVLEDGFGENGQYRRKRIPAIVHGKWWDGRLDYQNSTSQTAQAILTGLGFIGFSNFPRRDTLFDPPDDPNKEGSMVYKDFTIDRDRGIVQFTDYVIKFSTDGDPALLRYFRAAELKLSVATTVRDPETLAFDRYERSIILTENDSAGTDDRILILKHDELQLLVEDNRALNQQEVDAACDYYLAAALLEYQMPAGQDLEYAGLPHIELDGSIVQVGFSVGPQGATTRAGRSTEFDLRVPSYNERRFFNLVAATQSAQPYFEPPKKWTNPLEGE
jgi:hypothetical protein